MYKIKEQKKLNGRHRKEIRELEEICRRADNTKCTACLDPVQEAVDSIICFYLCYKEAELVSFLGIYPSEDIENMAEAVCFVHPLERRRGCFKKMFAKAKKELKKSGVEEVEFIHEPVSTAAIKVLAKLGSQYDRSEYLLSYDRLVNAGMLNKEMLNIETAELKDIDEIFLIYKEIFDYPESEIRLRLEGTVKADNLRLYKALSGDKIIGFVSIAEEENILCIFDFAVGRQYQHKGYGKTMLALLVSELMEQRNSQGRHRKIILHVSSNNVAAYNMYMNFGFIISERYDYYKVNIY